MFCWGSCCVRACVRLWNIKTFCELLIKVRITLDLLSCCEPNSDTSELYELSQRTERHGQRKQNLDVVSAARRTSRDIWPSPMYCPHVSCEIITLENYPVCAYARISWQSRRMAQYFVHCLVAEPALPARIVSAFAQSLSRGGVSTVDEKPV